MRHVELLAPHGEPIVVIMGSRIRSTGADYNVLEYYVADLAKLQRAVTFRVSGMITGPEEFIERIGPEQNHHVEIFGPDHSPEGRVRRLNKSDDYERDASSLVGAHALWLFVTNSDMHRWEKAVDDPEMVQIAHELKVPVLVFLPSDGDYEILELER